MRVFLCPKFSTPLKNPRCLTASAGFYCPSFCMTALFAFAWPTIESFQTVDGVTYRIDNGNVYSWPANVLLETLYDPTYIETNYREDEDGNPYIIDPATGIGYPAFRNLTEDFAGLTTLPDVVGIGKNWNAMTLHSGHYELPQEYVNIRQRYFAGLSDFVESRADVVPALIPNTDWPLNCESNRAGECCVIADSNDPNFVRFYAPAPLGRAVLTKCSIDNELLFITKGDSVRVTASFYRESGAVTGIMDLESSYIISGPGVRILFNTDHEARIELKWGDKPTWTQSGTPVTFPLGVWMKFSMYFELDDTSAGVIQLEIDDVLVIDDTGQTLAVPDAVYTRLEVGITTTHDPNGCVLFVKDISIVTS